ncbi:MAG: glycosyltransferase family 4 protein [Candidatus Thermoplasmatota archaeon]|nr:glycosyltransferase family 4 protein [Candidatus Thermoplasmatota archaeon]
MNKKLRVNITVCGKFHYFNFIKHIYEKNILKRFNFSNRLNAKKTLAPLPQNVLFNAWTKEYLTHFQMKYFSTLKNISHPFFHWIFDTSVSSFLPPSNINHIMLHGTSIKTFRKARKQGSVVVGEPVNSHPVQMKKILSAAANKWSVKFDNSLNPMQKMMLEEIKFTDFLLCPSSFIAESYIAQGYSSEKVKIIPWSVDTSLFYPILNQKKDSVFRLIFVGQLSLRKGILDLLQAWDELSLSNGELLIAGQIDQQIKDKLKFQSNVKYLGAVPHDELNRYYNKSNLFVLPTLEDGFGYVCLEAMAAGLPVIVTENTGAKDAVIEEKTGWIIPPSDIEQLKKTILKAYRNPELCKKMGATSATQMKKNYTWKNYADKLIQFYQGIY